MSFPGQDGDVHRNADAAAYERPMGRAPDVIARRSKNCSSEGLVQDLVVSEHSLCGLKPAELFLPDA